MKLAEALQERADLNRRIAQLNNRLSCNATVQEGEQPAENPSELLKELDSCIDRLEELICRINLTNCQTVTDSKTLTEQIAHRDCLKERLKSYRMLAEEASRLTDRVSRTEIRVCSSVSVKELQKQIDSLAKELRLADNRIQQTNWTTALL